MYNVIVLNLYIMYFYVSCLYVYLPYNILVSIIYIIANNHSSQGNIKQLTTIQNVLYSDNYLGNSIVLSV